MTRGEELAMTCHADCEYDRALIVVAIETAVAEEREACAKIAADYWMASQVCHDDDEWWVAADAIATEILARK